MDGLFVVVAIGWLTMAALGAWVADQKFRSMAEGFVLGLLFGPLGVIVEALLPRPQPPGPPRPRVTPAGEPREERRREEPRRGDYRPPRAP